MLVQPLVGKVDQQLLEPVDLRGSRRGVQGLGRDWEGHIDVRMQLRNAARLAVSYCVYVYTCMYTPHRCTCGTCLEVLHAEDVGMYTPHVRTSKCSMPKMSARVHPI